jgi:hypothetical protein
VIRSASFASALALDPQMVELVSRRTPSRLTRRRAEVPSARRIVHHELPWTELAAADEDIWQLLESYRRTYGIPRPELNRGLLVAFALSLLVWLVIAFAAVEFVVAR